MNDNYPAETTYVSDEMVATPSDAEMADGVDAWNQDNDWYVRHNAPTDRELDERDLRWMVNQDHAEALRIDRPMELLADPYVSEDQVFELRIHDSFSVQAIPLSRHELRKLAALIEATAPQS